MLQTCVPKVTGLYAVHFNLTQASNVNNINLTAELPLGVEATLMIPKARI
jgi:hypothetical protein